MRPGPSGRHAAARVPSQLVSQEVLQDLEIQRLVRHDALQPPVLVLQLLEPACLRDAHAAVLPTPAVERVRADPMPPAQLTRLCPGIGFRQDSNDLLLREPALPHDSSRVKEPHYSWIRFRGSAHIQSRVRPPDPNISPKPSTPNPDDIWPKSSTPSTIQGRSSDPLTGRLRPRV